MAVPLTCSITLGRGISPSHSQEEPSLPCVSCFSFLFVRKWSITNYSVQLCCEETRLPCVSCFPFLFVRKWSSKNKSVQWCREEPLLYEIRKGSHFFSLRNQDGSNYLFADDLKNHVYLVSPAQLKKNPKVFDKTVTVPFQRARNINHQDKIILSQTQKDKIVLSPGQDYVPGTKQFCPQDKILSPGQDQVWVWVFQVELNKRRNCIVSQFGEFRSRYSLGILAGETGIGIGTVSDSM